MSVRLICDGCHETISGTPRITSAEDGGTKLDFCSAICFIDHAKGIQP